MPSIQAPRITGIDLLHSPEILQELVDMLYALRNINLQLVTQQGSLSFSPGTSQIFGKPPNLTLPVPLKLQNPIADSAATAASASAQLNLLLAALRKTGQLPS